MSTPEIGIREATVADRAALEALNLELQAVEREIRASRALPEAIAAPFTDKQLGRLGDPDYSVLVAEAGGRVIGYITCGIGKDSLEALPREATIEDLVIEQGSRGRGVARRLVARAEAFARERGAHRLFVSHLVGNAAAGAAYDALGFVPSLVTVEKPL
ncbi:MAG: GNAT family N-acetyltransferase [Pseudomonadota bacterium]